MSPALSLSSEPSGPQNSACSDEAHVSVADNDELSHTVTLVPLKKILIQIYE